MYESVYDEFCQAVVDVVKQMHQVPLTLALLTPTLTTLTHHITVLVAKIGKRISFCLIFTGCS